MAGKIPTPGLEQIKQLDDALKDVATRFDQILRLGSDLTLSPQPTNELEKLVKFSGMFGKNIQKNTEALAKYLTKQKDLEKEMLKTANTHLKNQKKLEEEKKTLDKIKKLVGDTDKSYLKQKEKVENMEDLAQKLSDEFHKIDKELKSMGSSTLAIAKTMGANMLSAALDIGKAIASWGFELVTGSLKLLESGVQRVYELFERWTKVLGQFNMQLGVMSPNMGAATKEATRWEGEIRGLTDQFGQGIQMYQEFVTGFQRILPADQAKAWGKLGLDISRGLGLGGQAAGEFLKNAYQIGATADDVKKTYGEVFAGATAAQIPVNQFAKDLAEARDFSVQFGKAGQVAFVKTAAYARRLGVSLRSLRQFTDLTDTFESTAEAGSKLNSVFGTNINSLQLMLEQDPSKRLEMVKSELLSQGKTYDHLSRQERIFLAQTLKLSEEELAGVLKNGMTLDQFHKQESDAKAKQQKEDALLRKSTLATAETMFAFGQAADRITRALAKMLQPFLVGIGFAKKGKGAFSDFGHAMNTITDQIIDFIDSLSADEGFSKTLGDLGTEIKDVAIAFGDWVKTGGLKDLVSSLAGLAKTLVDVVIPAVQDFFKWLSSDDGKQSIRDIITLIHGLAAAVKPLGEIFGENGYFAEKKKENIQRTTEAAMVKTHVSRKNVEELGRAAKAAYGGSATTGQISALTSIDDDTLRRAVEVQAGIPEDQLEDIISSAKKREESNKVAATAPNPIPVEVEQLVKKGHAEEAQKMGGKTNLAQAAKARLNTPPAPATTHVHVHVETDGREIGRSVAKLPGNP